MQCYFNKKEVRTIQKHAQEIANRLNVRDLQEVNEIKTCESRMEVYESDY